MDYSVNGYEFFFEFDKIALYQGKYNYAAKFEKVLDALNRCRVDGPRGEVYGRTQQDARKAAERWAREWAEAQR